MGLPGDLAAGPVGEAMVASVVDARAESPG
jgi:hypothetical protein